MSSSRSDDVTQFVRSFVPMFVTLFVVTSSYFFKCQSVSQSVSHVFSNQLVQHISSFLLDLPKLFQYSSGWSHTIPSSPIQSLIVPYKSLRSQTVHEVPTVN